MKPDSLDHLVFLQFPQTSGKEIDDLFNGVENISSIHGKNEIKIRSLSIHVENTTHKG